MVVAPEPAVAVLPDVGRVVAGLDVADVVDDGEEGVHVVAGGALVRVWKEEIFLSNASWVVGVSSTFGVVPVVVVPDVGDEGRHVQELGEGDPGGDLLVEAGRVLEPLQVEAGHQGKLLHGQLLRRLLKLRNFDLTKKKSIKRHARAKGTW